jgi:HKD family nuclease
VALRKPHSLTLSHGARPGLPQLTPRPFLTRRPRLRDVSATTVLQNDLRPAEILAALEDLAVPDTAGLRLAVAYVTKTGCDELIPRLEDRIGTSMWSAIPKAVVTSFDFGLTEPEALRQLRDDHGFSIRQAVIRGPSFHPKLYAFTTASGLQVMAGSANLTRAAMTENSEMAVVTSLADETLTAFEQQWDELINASVPITDAALAEYAQQRKTIKRPVFPPDPNPKPRPIPSAGDLPLFPDEVASGRLDPTQFSSFWVEAGSMSSSASHAQLEMPRFANRFFGYSFSEYDSDHHLIGEPVLTAAGQVWDDRRLTWHGHNAMERLNLPTAHQGGFSYPETAILLTRSAGQFRLRVAAWDSDVAKAWRSASAQLGKVFRVGRTSRLCGLF